MPITLKILSYQRLTPGQQESFTSDRNRISIGRGSENDLTLPDPQRFMSGTHCCIENRGGAWHLTDTSTNGVFMNGSSQRVERGESVALNDGDRIKLGDYELEFQSRAAQTTAGPFEDDEDYFAPPPTPQPSDTGQAGKEVNTPLSQMDSSLLGDGVSIDQLHGLDTPEEEEEPPSLAGRESRGSPMRHHFSAPQVADTGDGDLPDKYAVDPNAIPDNWDEETGMSRAPVPAAAPPAATQSEGGAVEIPDDWDEETGVAAAGEATPQPPPVQAQSGSEPRPRTSPEAPAATRPQSGGGAPPLRADSAVAAFLSGAGLDPSRLRVEDQATFFHDLGALLRTMTEGIMQAVASRGQVKSEFRIEQTMIGPTENNPLKFSTSAEEAMTRLVQHGDRAYLAGAEAAREALDDINAHQMAVLAGTEAALRSILNRFRPASLESRLGGASGLGKFIPALGKAKVWEFYKALYDEVSEAADDDFHQFFGTEFSRAYEQQLERLIKTREDGS